MTLDTDLERVYDLLGRCHVLLAEGVATITFVEHLHAVRSAYTAPARAEEIAGAASARVVEGPIT